ncbi:aryl-alcohol dehydrogenase [NADP+] [Dentipellis sp. KUC8613]|nr:aryl-alcohol dehydrogenase [NADP+] [Dentipellis sp. KUC8613]
MYKAQTSESPLGRYRVLSPLAGVRVSPLQLGAMSIGDKWEARGFGAMNKESSFKLLDAFFEAGGNFIDTANTYQDESSEEILGEWMEARANREQIIIATKYSACYKRQDSALKHITYVGNSAKSLRNSVDASLKKLRTAYIDILYLHWWDWGTGVEEIMTHLHNLVIAGKVLYLGISNTPAWVVSKANAYARLTGKTPFCIYQGQWNVLQRSFERDIIPMARSEGLALAPWDVLGGGKLRTDAEEERRRETGEKGRLMMGPNWERTENERKMSAALEKVAKEVGAKSIQAVAIAYVLHKTTYVFPILGGRKVEHLHANIEALEIALSDEQIAYIESILPFDVGYPNWIIGDGREDHFMLKAAAPMDKWPLAQPIKPTPKSA